MFEIHFDRTELLAIEDAITRAHLKAGKTALEETTRDFEKRLEAATKSAAPGNLWRAWASSVEPKKGRIAANPVGLIYLNGADRTRGAMEHVTTSGRIASRNGKYLAIPLPAAGRRERLHDLTPELWMRRTGQKLRFIPPRRGGKGALLVLDKGTLRGKRQVAIGNTARRRKGGTNDQTIPIFVLIPARSFSSRFSTDVILAPAARELSANVVRHIGRIGHVTARSEAR